VYIILITGRANNAVGRVIFVLLAGATLFEKEA